MKMCIDDQGVLLSGTLQCFSATDSLGPADLRATPSVINLVADQIGSLRIARG